MSGWEPGLVVRDRGADDVVRRGRAVDLGDLASPWTRRVREVLVGEEVVTQALDEWRRHVAELGEASERRVVDEDGENLIVGLAAVEQSQATDGAGAHEQRPMRDWPLGEDADVERIPIANDARASSALHGHRRHALVAPRLRHEPVGGGAHVRELLRPVELQMPRGFVDLVLDGVRGHDLDERVHDRRSVRSDGDPVPWMGLQANRHVVGPRTAGRCTARRCRRR